MVAYESFSTLPRSGLRNRVSVIYAGLPPRLMRNDHIVVERSIYQRKGTVLRCGATSCGVAFNFVGYPARDLADCGVRDITINLYHLMDFGGRPFTAKVANTGDTVHSMDELVLIGAKCLREAVL